MKKRYKSVLGLGISKKTTGILVVAISALLAFAAGTALGLRLKEPALNKKTAQVTQLTSQLKQAKASAAAYKSYYQGEVGANNVAQADIVQLNAQIRDLRATPVVVYTAPTLVPPAALGGY